MSKEGNDNAQLMDAIAIGNANKKAIPLVKNWCKHVEITDMSAGMIAELYNLPMNQSISCKHTTNGFTAMNFDWIATDFIINSCIDCPHHKEVSANNYGRPLIKEYKRQLAENERIEKENKLVRQGIKTKLETLITNEKSVNQITALSVLKLIQLLDKEDGRIETSNKILEATKISPKFFNEPMVDYIAMYLETESANVLIEAINNIREYGTGISQFTFDYLVSVLSNINTLDNASKLLSKLIPDRELKNHIVIFESILEYCDYIDDYRRNTDEEDGYPNVALLFVRLSEIERPLFDSLIESRIKIDDKTTRLNTNGFLAEIGNINAELLIPFTPLLIKSFEFKDDPYGSSADFMTQKVLRKVYQIKPEFVVNEIEKAYLTLTDGAKIEILDFYVMLLTKEKDYLLSKTHLDLIIKKLINSLLDGIHNEKLKQKILECLNEISQSFGGKLVSHLDVMLGYLVTSHEDKVKLLWQIEDFQKLDKPSVTFNPLIGKNIWEIDVLKLKADNVIRLVKKIIQNIVKSNPSKLYTNVLNIAINIDSKKLPELKSSLIDVVRNSVKDTVTVSHILPNIHTFIHDIDSELVRGEGMAYLIHIINNHQPLVTLTFIDTVKIFIEDHSIGVRGRAIEAFGGILRHFPEYVEMNEIDIILKCILDKYVYVHKEASKLSYQLYPFLDEKRLNTLIYNLIVLEEHYFSKKEYDFCKDLVNMLLFVTKERPKVYSNIVTKTLVKHCQSKDYYSEKDAIERLTQIIQEFPVFQDIWLKNTLNFLLHTIPDPYGQGGDGRAELFEQFYKIKYEIIRDNVDLVKTFLEDRIKRALFADIRDCYCILAFYGLYEELNAVSDYFSNTIPDNASNEYIRNFNTNATQISEIEVAVANGNLNKSLFSST